jgi:serine protease Do
LKALSASQIYARSVPAIVLIKTPLSGGTGFCIASPGYILTNAHVVGGEKPVEVHPFNYVDQKPVQLPSQNGQVVYRSDEADVAVVRLRNPPETMKPLPVASFDAKAGAAVYAIGNPAMGGDVLEQTLSQGIVSHVQRQLQGNPYLQHTAAVNPGNSGGPLLDEKGQVVGVVTLKAHLQDVGFAIPASRIRLIFAGKPER